MLLGGRVISHWILVCECQMVERVRNFEEMLENMLLSPHLTHKVVLITLIVLAVMILLMTIYS